MRSAATIGNYDYLVDYVFKQDGEIRIAVGSTGIDAPKGADATDMNHPAAEADTMYASLIGKNLLAPWHSHFFNFRMDFDIDGEENTFKKAILKEVAAPAESPRTSIWTVEYEIPENEIEARTSISFQAPAYWMYVNENGKPFQLISCFGPFHQVYSHSLAFVLACCSSR